MKKSTLILITLAMALVMVALPLFSAFAKDKMPPPLDPQSWKLQEDMLWKDMRPNPVIDWMEELNPASLVNPKATGNKDPIRGALLLVDYWDRPFITTQPINSDLLGYYLFDQYGQYEDHITKNPIIHIDASEYTQWIADYLNKNQAINHYRSIDEYWREASYGKWQIELDSYGPYHLQGMEFEFSLNYTSNSDIPPTFRRSSSRSLVNESIALAYNNNVYLGDYDFFFILHAGYDESNVWYEFGQMQWASGADVPYEYGVRAKMDQIEVLLTEHPEYLLELEKPYVLSFSSTTPAINGYNANTYLRDTLAAVKAGTFTEFKFPTADRTWANGYTGQGSASLTGGLGGPNTAPTRYVRWTSWIASTSSWSSSSSATVPRSPGNGGGSRSVSYSQQGESDAMGTFAHEFGHIVSHTDNYEATMWTQNVSPKTDYWDLMSRGDKVGPGGYHARWNIPGGQEAGGSPGHFMMFPKRRSGYYDQGDLLELSVAQLKTRGPLVTNVVSRNIPMNNAGYYPQLEQYGLKAPNYYKGVILAFDSANADASTTVTTGYSNTRYRAGWTGIEVVDRSGYDSFQSDHGVLLSRIVAGSGSNPDVNTVQNRWVIDSHLYNNGLIAFYRAGEPTYYCIGHADQLNDALFHAGKSSVDSGYYRGDYLVNANGTYVPASGTKHGSMRQWEPRNGRDIVSGDTVNEWYDSANKLHFYILDINWHDGRTLPGKSEPEQFLSYQVGILHENGTAVGGDLNVAVGQLETETPGRVAVASFTITNTGAATDIIRVGVDGELNPTLLNDLYAVDAGQTITVPVYVDLPVDIRTKNMGGKRITLSASSESNSAKLGSASVAIEELVSYNYSVYVKPSKSQLFVGETFNVDIMLQGDTNYTQFLADVVYDPTLLKCEGYSNMSGFVTACSPVGPNTIGIRCIPSTNMIVGSPTFPEVRVVTLTFKVLNVFTGSEAAGVLSFSNLSVGAPAGFLLTGTPATGLPGGEAESVEIYRVGDESLQSNLVLYPGLFSVETGTTMPTFQYGSSNILEAVYVECPLDTDNTGKRDFIRVTIRRPVESGQNGLRVPVIMQDSPYIDGGGMSAPNYPITGNLQANASKAHYTYANDIESVKPRASEWPWGDDAVPALGIPASRGPKPLTNNGRGATVTSIYGTDMGTFASYFVPRGYAIVSTNSIGNRYSDGYTSCGDVDETVVAMAVIQWLNGKCRAYTDQNATQEVDATVWCNGNVAMSGVSYDGTLPIAVACSGVEGLKAAIPASAISSWYDYYRENGAVLAPGGYQGEDAVVLARYCFSRNSRIAGIPSSDSYYNNVLNQAGIGLRTAYEQGVLGQMLIDQDRGSGDYSRFWDDRNYLATADKITAGIIVTHGLNDWNVKMKQFDQFYRAVKEKSNASIKLVIGRGGHGGIYTTEAFFRNAHKWLDHYLYGIENNIDEDMPEVSVISSQTGRFEYFDSWPVPDAYYTKYYLAPDVDGAAGALSLTPPAPVTKTITDSLVSATLANWETRIMGAANLAAANSERLAFVSNITQNVRFSGTVKATLQVASDKPFGHMTAALVEIGTTATRSFATVTAESIAAHNGVGAITVTRPNSVTTSGTASAYKIVAIGHADVQNPNPSGKIYLDCGDTNYIPPYYYQTVATTPGTYYTYTFEFEPNDWEFRAGNKMAIMLYTADYRYTLTPSNSSSVAALTYQFGPGSFVEIPAVGVFNTVTAPLPLPEMIQEVEEISEIVEPGNIVQIDVNSGDALEIEIVK
jgi:X-Pro dipeptidyl-peptidase